MLFLGYERRVTPLGTRISSPMSLNSQKKLISLIKPIMLLDLSPSKQVIIIYWDVYNRVDGSAAVHIYILYMHFYIIYIKKRLYD